MSLQGPPTPDPPTKSPAADLLETSSPGRLEALRGPWLPPPTHCYFHGSILTGESVRPIPVHPRAGPALRPPDDLALISRGVLGRGALPWALLAVSGVMAKLAPKPTVTCRAQWHLALHGRCPSAPASPAQGASTYPRPGTKLVLQ